MKITTEREWEGKSECLLPTCKKRVKKQGPTAPSSKLNPVDMTEARGRNAGENIR